MITNLKEFYDNCPVGVCVVRRDRRNMAVLYANHALTHLMKKPGLWRGKSAALRPEEIVGRKLQEAWPSREMEALVRALQGAVPPRDYTLPVYDGDAADGRWAKLTIQEAEDGGEEVFVLWATDISASKEAEARLLQAVADADAAAETKSNFLATMSHEIRTPMQTVFGLLELIGEEKPDPRIKSMVDTAKNSASGLLEILDDILDFAKMDADKMELDTFEVPVRTLVRGILEALSVKVHGKDVQLIDDIEKDVPFVIIGDPKRLRQIIMNLAGNALKFTAKGSVTVRVTRRTENVRPPRNGLALRFEIIDTGIGMSGEACSRLFQPFMQADNSTSRRFGGTGLGLSICRKLVEMMGGTIGVTSVEGLGSTFWFEIPTQEIGTDASTADLPKLDGISVLSVEDHPQGAKEIVRSLESMGAVVESCPTCREALDLVKRRPFDVAVVDQGLPDGLGIDLIREIMNIRPYMGIIMYTVRDDAGMQHSLSALGVGYLSKPASRLGLGDAVKDAARRVPVAGIAGPSRLLIAEDTESVRDVLKRQLEKLGAEADFVEDGAAALAALETGRYGILFTDLHMPGIDGYGVVAEIRRREAEQEEGAAPRHMPVIVLTADVQMAQRQIYLSHGFDECLLKPVSLGQFRRLLIRWGLLDEESPAAAAEDPAALPAPSGARDGAGDGGEPPAIDLEAVKTQMGALDEDSIEMLRLFGDMTAPLVARLREAWEHRDFHGLKEAAHSLKGGARSACCNVLGDIAAHLQDDAAQGKDGCGDLVDAVETEFARVCAALKAL